MVFIPSGNVQRKMGLDARKPDFVAYEHQMRACALAQSDQRLFYSLAGKYRSQVSSLTSGRRQSKTPILSRNVDQKSTETLFSIAICRPIGSKWQSKTLFPATKGNQKHCFYRSLIRVRRLLITFSITAYPVCIYVFQIFNVLASLCRFAGWFVQYLVANTGNMT